MSKLMSVLGIVLLAIGAALALVGLVNSAQMQIYGLTMDTAAILLTGGVLSIGLGGVIAALQGFVPSTIAATVVETVETPAAPVIERPVFKSVTPEAPVVESPVAPIEEQPARIRFPGFGRKAADVATGAVASAAVVAATPPAAVATPAKSAVEDTIAALDQAKADIANAIGGVSDLTDPKADEAVEEIDEDEIVAEDDVEPADGELYVIEEREIRGRPARILSDQTVEAETDEGWMRFENLEHLNEYLDSMGETA
jgi:hypothetical protein